LATVRIYKVAELLGTTSQEVTALLKRDHGIEVKSASSTIEEVVARQFVERLARQRNVSLPTGDIFAEGPPAKGKKPVPAKPERVATANSQGIRLGNFVQIRDVIEGELENVFGGKKTAKQGLDDAVAKGNEVLKEFAAQNKP